MPSKRLEEPAWLAELVNAVMDDFQGDGLSGLPRRAWVGGSRDRRATFGGQSRRG